MDFERGVCEMIHYVQHDTIAVKEFLDSLDSLDSVDSLDYLGMLQV